MLEVKFQVNKVGNIGSYSAYTTVKSDMIKVSNINNILNITIILMFVPVPMYNQSHLFFWLVNAHYQLCNANNSKPQQIKSQTPIKSK